jgi:hypothetical protein
MATTVTRPRPTPPRGKPSRLPRWLTFTLVALLGILVYGMMVPKPPSAFDRPEAKTNPARNPWDAPRSF